MAYNYKPLRALILFPLLIAADYSTQPATIRIGNELCPQELHFLSQRLPYVKNTIEHLLDTPLSDTQTPLIALCCSGGSYRAMITMLGALEGIHVQDPTLLSTTKTWASTLHEYILPLWYTLHPELSTETSLQTSSLGLLDLCTYAAATSGSCWSLALLMQSRKSPQHVLDTIQKAITVNLLENPNLDHIAEQLLTKYATEQNFSLIDIFGCLLAQKLLAGLGHNNPNYIRIVDQEDYVATGAVPLPLYTAIIGSLTRYQWIEFSPFEVGGPYLNAYVPTWAFGRSFHHGVSQDCNPPQSLGFCMGLWGSAISLSMKDFFSVIVQPEVDTFLTTYFSKKQREHITLPLVHILEKMCTIFNHRSFTHESFLNERVSPPQVHNWTFGTQHPLGSTESLTLVDAGIDLNVPLPPLLNRPRAVDIIIMIDATIDSALGAQLKKAQQYAQHHKLPFPPVNQASLSAPCSLHKSADASTPSILYIQLVADPAYQNGWNPRTAHFTGTFNLAYTPQQTTLLSGLAQHTVAKSKPLLIEAIKHVVASKD